MRRQGVDHGQDGRKSREGRSEVEEEDLVKRQNKSNDHGHGADVSPTAGEARMTEGQCGCEGVDERKIIILIPYVSRHTLAHC